MKGIDYGKSRNMKISFLHQIKNSGKLLRPSRKHNILPFPKEKYKRTFRVKYLLKQFIQCTSVINMDIDLWLTFECVTSNKGGVGVCVSIYLFIHTNIDTSSHAQHMRPDLHLIFFIYFVFPPLSQVCQNNMKEVSARFFKCKKTQTEVHKPKPVNCIITAKLLYLLYVMQNFPHVMTIKTFT